jgi:hypothetical protein
MTTYNIKVTGTNYSPFNSLCAYDVYDGGYFIDPMAEPLSFYYASSAIGGKESVFHIGNFQVLTQELSPQSLFFKSDGYKMFVLGTISDRVYEYDLSTPWDVQSSKYNSKFYSINSQETVPTGLFFRSNGLSMYLVGVNADSIYQYTLTNSWEITSSFYSSKSFSVGVEQNQPRGMYIRSDGLKMYVVGTSGSKITEYNLGVAWDISTASYTTKYFSVSNQESFPEGISFKSDGTKTFVVGSSGRIIEYNLSTPWDITTANYNSIYVPISSEDSYIKDLYFKDDGNLFYVVGNENAGAYSYGLTDSWIISGWGGKNYSISSYGGNFFVGYNDLSNIKQKVDGNYVFCDSEVIFDFSEFDQTKSKIVKILFNPDNGNDHQSFTSYVDENNSLIYPILSSIKTKYYPSELFYTYYNPNFIIDYADGTSINLTIPITSVQCGIYETYKDKNILESLPYYKNISNILLFVNDNLSNETYIGDIYTKLPFILSANLPEKDIELPNLIKVVPIGSTIDSIIEPIIPNPVTNKNPVLPPIPIIIYSEYDGISIFTNNSQFYGGDELVNIDNSLTISSGGIPYFGGTGITISIITDLNN